MNELQKAATKMSLLTSAKNGGFLVGINTQLSPENLMSHNLIIQVKAVSWNIK